MVKLWLGWSKVEIKLDKRPNGLGPPIPGIEGLDVTTNLTFDLKTLQSYDAHKHGDFKINVHGTIVTLEWKNTNVEFNIKKVKESSTATFEIFFENS